MNRKSKQEGQKGLTPIDAAMRYLGYSARTVREVERHLDEKQFGEVEIYDAVERLKELNLLNDTAYCSEFVASRLRTKPVSRMHLRRQLKEHEADEEAIFDALSLITDDMERDSARAVAEKYFRQFAGMDAEECRRKVQQRLEARGYDYDTIRLVSERREDSE